MANETKYPLSLIIRSVDNATAGFKRINQRIEGIVAPVKRLNGSLGAMAREAGLPKLVDGFRGVGNAIKGVIFGLGAIAAAAGLGVHALLELVNAGDELGALAQRLGISVDALAQLRFAAEKSDVEVGEFDAALGQLNKRLGEMKAGGGSLDSFLKKVSPSLRAQVKNAKNAEEAFGFLAEAMAKLEDPTKQAALANAAFGRGGAPLVNMLARGKDGVEELKQKYFELAGSQQSFADSSGRVDDKMKDLGAAMQGVRATILTALAPAFEVLAEGATKFFEENREAIADWVKDFGEKLPGRIDALMETLGSLRDAIKPVWDAIGGLRGAAIALAAVMGIKLILAIKALGVAMLTTPIGLILTAIGLLVVGGMKLVEHWDAVKEFFVTCWEVIRDAFMAAFNFISKLLMDWSPVGLIVKHWEPIKKFFVGLWDGVVAAFESAWQVIKKIVDSVMWAVDKVVDAKNFLTADGDAVGGVARSAISAAEAARPPAAGAGGRSEAKVKVEFGNAPPGTRVTTDPRSTANVDTKVGYQMVL